MDKNNPLYQIRHSAAHIVAQAVIQVWPTTLQVIGPVTEHGFFADLSTDEPISEQDLAAIENRMRAIINQNLEIIGRQVTRQEAKDFFKNNPFKQEIIDRIPEDETITIYTQGEYSDLCAGGHTKYTGDVKYFKLMSVAGVYWKGDCNNASLQRISGIAFETQHELDEYLRQLEHAKLYDHRLIGKNQELFTMLPEAPGMAFWLPKGLIVYNLIMEYIRGLLKKYDYLEIKTPLILSCQLWKTSGHYDNYKDDMFFVQKGQQAEEEFAVRPMNCPCAALVYKDSPKSYRQLPLRLAEFGMVHRNELSGTLHGLFRVRSFTQDDAHVFCTTDQVAEEVTKMLAMFKEVFTHFGFGEIKLKLSTRPAKSIGSDELWDKATNMLRQALEANNLDYTVDEGGGAFYGPKIDTNIKDSIGRHWQCGTIQVDFNLPQRFNLEYVTADQQFVAPVTIHRAILGSLERFIGILLENCKGRLPAWLAPVQAIVLPITNQHLAYAEEINAQLLQAGIRSQVDSSNEKINAKIRDAQLMRVPYMLVVGGQEAQNNTVCVRNLDGEQLKDYPINKFIDDFFKK